MLVKNMTDKEQKLILRELTGNRKEFPIYVVKEGVTAIDKSFEILGIQDLIDSGVFTIVSEKKTSTLEDVFDSMKKKIEEVEPPKEEVESPKEEVPVSDTFVCEECKLEFASARGLAMHNTKVHAS